MRLRHRFQTWLVKSGNETDPGRWYFTIVPERGHIRFVFTKGRPVDPQTRRRLVSERSDRMCTHRRLVCVFTPFTFHQPGKWERFLTSFTPVTWKIWNNVISGVAQQMSIVPFFQFQVSTFENGDRKSHWLNAMGWVTHNMAPYCNLVPPWYITMEYLRKQRLFFFPPMKKKIQFSRICVAAHDVFPVGKILRRTSWWHHLEEKIGIFNIS